MSHGQEGATRAPDRTSLVVLLGMVALTIIGVATVFGEAIVAIVAPPTDAVHTPRS